MSPEQARLVAGPGKAGAAGAELVAAVSHELRQPLASIRGFTEMLLAHWGDFTDQEKQQMLEQVLHESKRVGRLVDEMVEGSRSGPGALRLRLAATDMGQVVLGAVRNLQAIFAGLEIDVDIPGDLPLVEADAFKLEQVVANLIENAHKYGAPGGTRVSLACGGDAAAPGAPGLGALIVTVSDEGPGIATEDLPHVTEKFYRSPGNGPGGLGLGLWISRGIVEAHRGRLWVTSAPGKGTTAAFAIPLRPEAKAGKLAGP